VTQKRLPFQGFRQVFKINSTCPTYLLDKSLSTAKTRDPLSLQRLMESNFDSNLFTLSRGVLPIVKYQGSLPISTSMISTVVSMVIPESQPQPSSLNLLQSFLPSRARDQTIDSVQLYFCATCATVKP
jgi:hypothetical protein